MAYRTAGVGAAIMAAAIRQQMLLEEEEMTSYSQNELDNNWEFKIVRANTGVFGNAEELKKLLQEESRAGWSMVEKFDNSRIRFKRPQSARLNDARLPPEVDPYRVHYGMLPAKFAALMVAVSLGITFGIMALVFILLKAFIYT